MNRRDFLKTGIAAGISVTIPGCTGLLGGSNSNDRRDRKTPTTTPEPEAAQETFTYIFDDQTGSIGQVGDQQVPEDAPSWKIVENTLEESEWQQMQNNDLDGEGGATDVLAEGEGPQAEGFQGSIEAIKNRTEEILQNPQESFSEGGIYQVENIEEEHDAVVYTRALTAATWEETNIGSSAVADLLIPTIAEPLLDEINLEIPGYSLSTNMATEECGPGMCSWAEDNVPRDVLPSEDRQNIKVNSGFNHPTGLLQYENSNGEQEIKYAEVTGSHQSVFTANIRDPKDSLYTLPLSKEPNLSEGEVFPEHFVTALEYTKARELEQMGGVGVGRPDWAISVALSHLVDDIENDLSAEGVKSYGDTPGFDIIVEDSFGESLEEFKRNPTKQKAEYLENTARGMKLAYEKQGYDEPLRLSGTIEDPTYEHLARDEFKQIIDQRQQRISS